MDNINSDSTTVGKTESWVFGVGGLVMFHCVDWLPNQVMKYVLEKTECCGGLAGAENPYSDLKCTSLNSGANYSHLTHKGSHIAYRVRGTRNPL